MKIEVKLFAAAREKLGADAIEVQLAATATVADLRAALRDQVPQLQSVLATAQFAVDQQYVPDDFELHPQMEVACIPPVSGG